MTEGNIKVYEKDSKRIVYEQFPSIYQLLNCINTRPNNSVMKEENSSESGSKSFTGTDSYEEAESLLISGYTDILGDLKLGIKKATKSLQSFETPKSYLIEDVHGGVPIIPNYLAGLPKTMSYRQTVPKKTKTINIIYAPAENCNIDTEEFIKAGVAVLSAIRIIEKGNVAVKLDCMFSESRANDEYCFGSVRIKNYSDRLDLQKLCFPIAHPSMLRRIGFKFIETALHMKDRGFRDGYGSSVDLEQVEKVLDVPKNTVILNLRYVSDNLANDPKKVIEYINKKITEK